MCDEIIYYQKQFLNIVAILSFDLFGFIKPTTYQDHLQIRYKMGFWHTCHVTPQTFAVTSYIFPHRLHYLIMLSDSNEVVYFPRWQRGRENHVIKWFGQDFKFQQTLTPKTEWIHERILLFQWNVLSWKLMWNAFLYRNMGLLLTIILIIKRIVQTLCLTEIGVLI